MTEDPLITEARRIGEMTASRRVLILCIRGRYDDQVQGASWGRTRALCQQTGRWLDRLCALVEGHRWRLADDPDMALMGLVVVPATALAELLDGARTAGAINPERRAWAIGVAEAAL